MKECSKIKKLFGAYLYNNATPTERDAVESHINDCEECASDLRSRQAVLEELKSNSQPDEIPQKAQDDFALNVYRKIASETLQRRSRRILLRRFILQPSLATLALAIVITIGFVRLQSPDIMHRPNTVRTDEADRKEYRASLYEKEFFRRQGTPYETESVYAATEETSANIPSPLDADRFVRNTLLPDSRRRLEEANFIYYSLREPRRALAEYQWVVDYYPNTNDAREAKMKIKAILDSEYRIQGGDVVVELAADMGI